MGRIRCIKPEVNEDELVAGLSSDAWRLWVSMWTFSDDQGTCRASPRYLKAKVFWARDPVAPIESLLEELVAARRVKLYAVEGERFASVRNFGKHQRIDKPGPPKYPGPDELDAEADDDAGPARDDSRTLQERSTTTRERSPLDGKGEEGRGGDGIAGAGAPAPPPVPPKPPKPGPAKPKRVATAARAGRIPADWEPSPRFWAWVAAGGYDAAAVRAEVPDFRDWWTAAKDGEKSDWDATLRGRIRKLVAAGAIRQLDPATLVRPKPVASELLPDPESRARAGALLMSLAAAKTMPPPDIVPASELRRRAGWVEPECEAAT